MTAEASTRAPRTGAQRKAKYRAQGRQIAVVLRDERAIASLDRLREEHGGVTAAVTAALVAAPLRRVPVIRPGEIPLPTGPGLPPPSQPTLSGMEPVLFRDPDTGELFDVDPTSGELQARLPIQASPEAPQAPPAPAEPPSTGQRMKDALADAGDALTAWERGFFADLTARLDAGAILSDRQEAKALSILNRIED